MNSTDSVPLAGTAVPLARDRQLFGHPIALMVLCLSAMWEIFALVGMRAVLVYYLVEQLKFSERDAVQLYGFSTSAAFLMALLGGVVADRYIGAWRAALIGALLLGAGFFLLSSPSFLYPGLAAAALGSGLFKPTMLAQVGLLYANDDPRRDRAYNVYYVGSNLSGTLAPLICGALGVAYGWNWAFIAAGIGMILSVATLIGGRPFLPRHAVPARSSLIPAGSTTVDGRRTFVLLAIAWLAAVLFWAAYGQIGGTIALWVQSDVDRAVTISGREWIVPAAWFQSINPFLVFVLVPVVNGLWMRDRAPVSVARDMRKMAIGGVHLAVSFGILAAVAALDRGNGGANALWVVLAIVPFTLGELYLNTIGQSLFSRLALQGMVSVFMGIWILTLMLGYAAAGWLGGIWTQLSAEAFFGLMVGIALASTAILAAARHFLAQPTRLSEALSSRGSGLP